MTTYHVLTKADNPVGQLKHRFSVDATPWRDLGRVPRSDDHFIAVKHDQSILREVQAARLQWFGPRIARPTIFDGVIV